MPDVPGAAAVIAAQEQVIRAGQGIGGLPNLPGLEVSHNILILWILEIILHCC